MEFDSALEKVSAFKPIQLAVFTFICLSKSFVVAIIGVSVIFIGKSYHFKIFLCSTILNSLISTFSVRASIPVVHEVIFGAPFSKKEFYFNILIIDHKQ